MRILVIGGTGFTGSRVVERAMHLGHEVTVMTRRPGGVPGATVVVGDPRDTGTMRSALRGQNVVVLCLGVGGAHHSGGRGDGRATTVVSDTARVVVSETAAAASGGSSRAVEDTPPPRLVAMSNVGAGGGGRPLSAIRRRVIQPAILLLLPWLRPIVADKTTMENLIAESGIDYTIIRFPDIVDRPERSTLRVSRGARSVGASMTVTDAAALLVLVATTGAWSGEIVEASN